MPDYIIEPLDTDADAIFQGFVEYVKDTFPDWEPSEGQLDVIIARYFAMQTAFTADMASRVQRAIFRYFGASLANLPPLIGSHAFATISFVIDDPSEPPIDRTLPFGTLVGLTDSDGDIQMFSLTDDMDVAAGALSATAEAEAIEAGVVANEISGTVELVEQVDWITSASVLGVSSGGSDPEQDEHYIQRLTENLALMAPRPILADDFTVFARNVPGVWRAAVIDNYRDTGGGSFATDQENSIAISATNEAGEPLSDTVRDQLIAYLESTRSQNFVITFIEPTYYTVDINYTVRINKNEAPSSVESLIEANLTQYLSPANWGKDPFAQDHIWVRQSALRYLELTTIVENTPGVDYIESLTFRIDGGAFNSLDKTIDAAFGLTRPGDFDGTINLPI